MTPTTPGSYEFKGQLEHLSHGLPLKTYPDWTHVSVLRDEEGRLHARILDEDGHYSGAFLIQFTGEWRQPVLINQTLTYIQPTP